MKWTDRSFLYNFIFLFYFGATPGYVLSLLRAPHSRITPSGAQGTIEEAGIKPRPAACKANALFAVNLPHPSPAASLFSKQSACSKFTPHYPNLFFLLTLFGFLAFSLGMFMSCCVFF